MYTEGKDKEELSAAFDKALKYNAITDAEKMLGREAPQDTVMAVAMLSQIANGEKKKRLAKALDDTVWGGSVEETLRVAKSEGFEVVKEFSFTGVPYGRKEEYDETLYVLFHKELGILATVESYEGQSTNKSHIYYNWVLNNEDEFAKVISSGGFFRVGPGDHDLIWSGDHDVCEAFRHKLHGLKEAGTFVTPWQERPYLWLVTYMDERVAPKTYPASSQYYDAINEARIGELPEEVRHAITPPPELKEEHKKYYDMYLERERAKSPYKW